MSHPAGFSSQVVDSLMAGKIGEGDKSEAGTNLAEAPCVQRYFTGEESHVREGVPSESDHQATRVERRFVAAVMLLIALLIWSNAIAGGPEEGVCDVDADYALGTEDYAQAIRLHREIVRKSPNDALAHYHLGFAEGMIGDLAAEIDEYQRAKALGLTSWDLFLNIGLAQRERGDLDAAAESLRTAVDLGEDHPEPHFNLALVDEQRGMLLNAEQEAELLLKLSPGEVDARNLLGVIYARRGETLRASQTWQALLRDQPDYRPARINLLLLSSTSPITLAETAAAHTSPAAAVEAPKNRSKLCPAGYASVSYTK
jgi:tetratricopeptide (TPR) repeat protein